MNLLEFKSLCSLKKKLFFSLLLTNFSYSQSISGTIVSEDNKPVEFLEVILYGSNGNALKSELTDYLGNFNIEIEKGIYTLKIRQLGEILYEKDYDLNTDISTGILVIKLPSQQLREIVVTSEAKLIEKKIDRIVFNVENSVAATGGNALDALKLTPRIKVDNENISMIGKGSMKVMINDKLLTLTGDELANYLKTISSSELKKIEVISNPPSRYSAEGNSGLINIVTKKSKHDSWNSSLNSIYQQGNYPKANIGGTFNLRKEKIQFTSGFNYINGYNKPTLKNVIYYPNLTWNQNNSRKDLTNANVFRIGTQYQINDKLSTGLSYNYVKNNAVSDEKDYVDLFSSTAIDSTILTLAHQKSNISLGKFNYNLNYKLDSIGTVISLDFDYFNYKIITNRSFATQTFIQNINQVPTDITEGRNAGNQNIDNYSINLDIEHPLVWANFNYGSRLSVVKTRNDFNYYDIINNLEYLNANLSNEFRYKEYTQALYFSVDKEISKTLELKIGIRYELTKNEGFSKTLAQTNNSTYNKLFPTLYLSYKPNENNSFSFDYGKRIDRPSFGLLNPFRFVLNPYSFSEGNPFLQPAFTHNIQFEYLFKNNFISSIYYSNTYDNYEQVTILDSTTNIQQIKPLNFFENNLLGMNVIYIFKPLSFWEMSTSLDLFYSNTYSEIPITLENLKGWNGVYSISNDVKLNSDKTLVANLNYSYASKGVTNLSYNSSSNQLDSTLKWLLLNRDLILSINVNDIFGSNRTTYTSYFNSIKNSFTNYNDSRFFRLGLTYNFGQKLNIKDDRQNKNQEEQNRIN